jgi:hypothetical protein
MDHLEQAVVLSAFPAAAWASLDSFRVTVVLHLSRLGAMWALGQLRLLISLQRNLPSLRQLRLPIASLPLVQAMPAAQRI